MTKQWRMRLAILGVVMLAPIFASAQQKEAKAKENDIERGRYVIIIAGCNDCHTANYGLKDGKIPESEWLKGDILGWNGPWGTTYPANLRDYLHKISEDEWVKRAKTLKTRPPMPWFNVNHWSEADARAVYRYVKHLGPGGNLAPAYVPPDKQPTHPYITFPPPPPAK
jgi:mono/diheme cytochrome c family protein